MIQLSSQYQIDVDQYNYTLQEHHVSSKGEEYWTSIGYYSSLEECLRGYLKKAVVDSLEDVTIQIEDICNVVTSKLDQVLEEFKEKTKDENLY